MLYKTEARLAYDSVYTQWAIAALIMINFVTNIVEKQIDPYGTVYAQTFEILEDTFNVLFLIELIWNFYGHAFIQFCKSGWNWFDVLVVFVGILSLMRQLSDGPLRQLRMLRAFRVFRLFKRIKSLNKIIVSLGKAVPGVLNAFFVVFLVMCIYAILGVEFFLEFGKEEYIDDDNVTRIRWEYASESGQNITSETLRGFYYGDEYFGNFFRSLFSLFQVLTGESWAEVVVRPLIFGWSSLGAGLYFISFIILTSIVLVNVVVAVLLEKMVDDDDKTGKGDYVEETFKGEASCRGNGTESRAGSTASLANVAAKAKGVHGKQGASADLAQLKRDVSEMKQQLACIMKALNVESSEAEAEGKGPAEATVAGGGQQAARGLSSSGLGSSGLGSGASGLGASLAAAAVAAATSDATASSVPMGLKNDIVLEA